MRDLQADERPRRALRTGHAAATLGGMTPVGVERTSRRVS
jgi:hypothetical protein